MSPPPKTQYQNSESKEHGNVTEQTFTITDNRDWGCLYDLPVTHDTIKALDLRQIKVLIRKNLAP